MIGQEKDKFRFGKSGFDTEENSALALQTLQQMNYTDTANRDGQSAAAILALTHLCNSEHPASEKNRRQLAEWLANKVVNEGDTQAGKLHRADLKLLVELYPADRLGEITTLYRSVDSPVLQAALVVGIQNNFRHRSRPEPEAEVFLSNESMGKGKS